MLGALLMLGLFTRLVAFILAVKWRSPISSGTCSRSRASRFLPLINGGTAAILFCFACLYLASAGGGPYSVDAMMRKK